MGAFSVLSWIRQTMVSSLTHAAQAGLSGKPTHMLKDRFREIAPEHR
jgi:hypothetical protein